MAKDPFAPIGREFRKAAHIEQIGRRSGKLCTQVFSKDSSIMLPDTNYASKQLISYKGMVH